MRQIMCLAILSVSLILTACAKDTEAPAPKPVIQTVVTKPNIPIQRRPQPVELREIDFFVVTKETLSEFEDRFVAAGNEFVFVAISIDDYENLALNIAELRRYIEQQGSLIVYYENSVKQ